MAKARTGFVAHRFCTPNTNPVVNPASYRPGSRRLVRVSIPGALHVTRASGWSLVRLSAQFCESCLQGFSREPLNDSARARRRLCGTLRLKRAPAELFRGSLAGSLDRHARREGKLACDLSR